MTGPIDQGWDDFQPRTIPQNVDDLLWSDTNMAAGLSYSKTVTLNNRYLGIMVVLQPPNLNQVTYTVKNNGVLGIQQQQIMLPGGPLNGTQAFFPMVNFIQDTVTVTVTSTGGFATGSIFIFGVRDLRGVLMRADGRPYPIGSHTAYLNITATGSSNIIAAPVAPVRILIRDVQCMTLGPAASSFIQISAAVNGVTQAIYGHSAAVANTSSISYDGGLLIDISSAVSVTEGVANSNNTVNISYDLVI